jgi:hypothetical protein
MTILLLIPAVQYDGEHDVVASIAEARSARQVHCTDGVIAGGGRAARVARHRFMLACLADSEGAPTSTTAAHSLVARTGAWPARERSQLPTEAKVVAYYRAKNGQHGGHDRDACGKIQRRRPEARDVRDEQAADQAAEHGRPSVSPSTGSLTGIGGAKAGADPESENDAIDLQA